MGSRLYSFNKNSKGQKIPPLTARGSLILNLALYSAEGYAADDVLGNEEVYDDNGDYSEECRHINDTPVTARASRIDL